MFQGIRGYQAYDPFAKLFVLGTGLGYRRLNNSERLKVEWRVYFGAVSAQLESDLQSGL
jgi:hypothetical protein